MSKLEKAIQRLMSIPTDFTWNEYRGLLYKMGFDCIEGTGSRVKFFHPESGCLLQLHRPHPGSIMKRYQLRESINILMARGLL